MRPFLLPVLLCSAALAACVARETDEQVIRREYDIPAAARVLVAQISPAEAGWFGREGLKITMVFALSEGDFDTLRRRLKATSQWQPLPIPETTLAHLAGIRRARAAGGVGNSTDQQLLAQFRQTMPPHPPSGWYQIRTAGTNILHAPKTVRDTLNTDVNDFMLAVLDPQQHTVMVRVSTNY